MAAYDESNVFARILKGDVACEKLYEDEFALAFKDIHPQAASHFVVVSKGSYTSLDDFTAKAKDAELAGFLRAIGTAAGEQGLNMSGYRVVSNVGANARQEIEHFHVHVLGGERLGPILPKKPEDRKLVLLLEPKGEPTAEQAASFAEVMGMTAYAAAPFLGSPLPQVILTASADEVRPLARKLGEAGFELGCLELDMVQEHLAPWIVEWLEIDGEDLYAVGAEGRTKLVIDTSSLLVRGKYHPQGKEPVAFAHLYQPDQPRPFCFAESEIRDYMFLGDDKQASSHANFQLLLEVLTGPWPQIHEAMLEHPLRVKTAVEPLNAVLGSADVDTPDIAAEFVSRLIYFSSF